MARIDLHNMIKSLTPTGWNIYFQPPESIKLSFPCIIYGRGEIDAKYADDKMYVGKRAYNVQIISRDPECTLAETLMMNISGCKSTGLSVIDNLYHDNLTIYY